MAEEKRPTWIAEKKLELLKMMTATKSTTTTMA